MKRYRIIYVVIIALLLFVNAFILLNRNEGYKYFPYKSYSQLYVTDSNLYLKDVHFNNNTLELYFSLSLTASRYNLIIDDRINKGPISATNNVLIIPLFDNIHVYKLIPENDKLLPVTVQVDHSKNPGADYTNEFIYSNLAGPQIKVSPYDLWTKGLRSFTADEIKNGKAFLAKNTSAFAADTDSAKLMEVCRLISNLRPNVSGIKAGDVSLQAPYKQLQLAMQNRVNLDCGNYSVMLHYLCCLLNLPNRVITFSGPAGNWQFGVHYYNEIYLREKQQWVLCDGLTNTYMPHDSIRFYNAADVYKMAHTNSFNDKYIYTFDHDKLENVRYDSVRYWHWYYNRNNANLCYLHPGTGVQDGAWNYLKDFYSFSRNFDFYSDINQNDWLKITVKMVAFYSLIIVATWYLLWEIKTFRKRSTRHKTVS